MAVEEIEGVIIFVKPHREKDYLVKMFTNRYGPLMFFVRGTRRPDSMQQHLLPLTIGTFYADIRKNGLSFIQAIKETQHLPTLQTDIKKNAYGIYVCMLTDAAIADHEPNVQVFQELVQSLHSIENGSDPEIIAFMNELKRLSEFGVQPNWVECAICHRTDGVFDYSSKYHGLLCPNHFSFDLRRYHAKPAAIHLLRQLNFLNIDRLGTINVKSETKQEMKRILDQIYEENVGIHLKSKYFIDQMQKYESFFKESSQDIDK